MVHRSAIWEPHLHLRRVDVHIDLVGRQFQKQKDYGIAARHDESAICFLQCVRQAAVADWPTVYKQILQLGVTALARGIGDEATELRVALLCLNRIEGVADFRAKEY